MAPSNPYEAFDQEIASIFEVYLTLKIRRNDLVPIVRLPPEILSAIFIEHARMLPDDEWPMMCVPPSYSWIAITHICKRWRDIALSTAALWTTIWLSWMKREAVEAFLFRSKQAPLVINIRERAYPRCREVWRILTMEASRTRQLSLEMPRVGYEDINFKDFPDILPVLHSLELSSELVGAKLPWFVSQESAPNLTVLRLHNFIVRWSPHTFSPTLRNLKIFHKNTVTGGNEHRVPLSQVIAAVTNLHLLEKLILLDVFMPVSDVSALPEIVGPTLMSYMVTLHLRGPILAIFRFLDFLVLPVCTDIYLDATDPYDAERASVLASSLISTITLGAKWVNTTPAIEQLLLSFEELLIVTRRVLHQQDSDPIKPDDVSRDETRSTRIRVSTCSIGRLGRLPLPIWALAAHLPLNDVSVLTLNSEFCMAMTLRETVPTASWWSMRLAMQNVATLILQGSTPTEIPFLNSLILDNISSNNLAGESLEGSPRPQLFPKLSQLFVNSGFFEKSRSPGSFKVGPSDFVEELRWLVEHCATQLGRASIEKITVLDSLDMDPSDVSALEKFVAVTWDGKRRPRFLA